MILEGMNLIAVIFGALISLSYTNSGELCKTSDMLKMVGEFGNGTFYNTVLAPDRETVYIAGSLGLMSWTLRDPQSLPQIFSAPSGVAAVEILDYEDNKLLLGLGDGSIMVFSPVTLQSTLLASVNREISSLSLSYDGSSAAVNGEAGQIALLDISSSRFIEIPNNVKSPVVFSPSESVLIASDGVGLVQWNYETDRQIHITVPDSEEPVTQIAFSPDGRFFASATRAGLIHVWETNTGKLLHSFDSPFCCPSAIGFASQESRLLVTYDTSGLLSWSLEAEDVEFTLPTIGVVDFAVIPDSPNLIIVKFSGGLEYWDTSAVILLAEVINPVGFNDFVQRLNEIIMIASYNAYTKTLTMREVDNFEAYTDFSLSGILINLAIASDLTEFSYYNRLSEPTIIQRIRITTKNLIQELEFSLSEINDIAYDSSARFIAIAGRKLGEGSVYIYDIEHEEIFLLADNLDSPTMSVAWLHHIPVMVSTQADGSVMIWDIPSSTLVHTINFPSRIDSITISETDQHLIVLDEENNLNLLDLGTREKLLNMELPFQASSINVSASGNIIAVGSNDGRLVAYSLQGDELFNIKAHAERIHSIVFDRQKIITASMDNSIKIWLLNTPSAEEMYYCYDEIRL